RPPAATVDAAAPPATTAEEPAEQDAVRVARPSDLLNSAFGRLPVDSAAPATSPAIDASTREAAVAALEAFGVADAGNLSDAELQTALQEAATKQLLGAEDD